MCNVCKAVILRVDIHKINVIKQIQMKKHPVNEHKEYWARRQKDETSPESIVDLLWGGDFPNEHNFLFF